MKIKKKNLLATKFFHLENETKWFSKGQLVLPKNII